MDKTKVYDLKEAQKIFENDRYATYTSGMEIVEVAKDYAKCRMEVEDKHRNAHGAVMGGAIFTLADFAFAVASNYNATPTVTLSSQILYLSGVRGNTIFAETNMIKNGRRNCFCEITVTDELGTKVALVSATGAHV